MLNSNKWGRYFDVLRWLQNRLYPYTENKAFTCKFGIPFEVFRTENLVLELDKGFTDLMYSFVVSHIAEMLYSYNIEMGLIGSNLRTLFNVDEARILFNAHRNASDFGESILDEIVSKSREFGLGFFLSSQETASFNQVVRSLAYLKIAFPLNDAEDVKFIRESFGLDDEQAAYLFRLPPYGRAIVRYGGYEKPFLMQVPHFRIKRHLTDDEVEDRMAGFYTELASLMRTARTSRPLEIKTTIPPHASALLFFLGKEPFTKVSEMTRAEGFKSPDEVNKTLNRLETDGYIKRESYRVSKRGRKSTFAVLREKAYAYLGIEGLRGKGGFEHSLYQQLIHTRLKADGVDCRIEGKIEGSNKACDVLTHSAQGCVAYEVTLHFDNLLSNIHQDMDAGAAKVIIVTRDTPGLNKAQEMVQGDSSLAKSRENISFYKIDHFFG